MINSCGRFAVQAAGFGRYVIQTAGLLVSQNSCGRLCRHFGRSVSCRQVCWLLNQLGMVLGRQIYWSVSQPG